MARRTTRFFQRIVCLLLSRLIYSILIYSTPLVGALLVKASASNINHGIENLIGNDDNPVNNNKMRPDFGLNLLSQKQLQQQPEQEQHVSIISEHNSNPMTRRSNNRNSFPTTLFKMINKRKRSIESNLEPSKWSQMYPESTSDQVKSQMTSSNNLDSSPSLSSGETYYSHFPSPKVASQRQQVNTNNNNKYPSDYSDMIPIECCPTKTDWISPRGGVSRDGRILEVFHDSNTSMIQTFQQVSCSPGYRGRECLFTHPKAKKRSMCVQKYSFTYAIVREYGADDSIPWRLDQIRIRSGCSCHIGFSHQELQLLRSTASKEFQQQYPSSSQSQYSSSFEPSGLYDPSIMSNPLEDEENYLPSNAASLPESMVT